MATAILACRQPLVLVPGSIWLFCRIEPGPDQLVVPIAKTGEHLPPGQIPAREPLQNGIALEVLPEGRYFPNPHHWG
jgi:hypothetical protein